MVVNSLEPTGLKNVGRFWTSKVLYFHTFSLVFFDQWLGRENGCRTEPQKNTLLLSIESWLFNRDPYNGL